MVTYNINEEMVREMKVKNIVLHFGTVCEHKWRVLINCARCGIFLRGLVHDLSKFSPEEFFESARFYQGNRSPIGVCRRTVGYSRAWLHHKGRNKHHIEYWTDPDCVIQPLMPYKYAVECVCDKLAATRTYLGRDYESDKPLWHWRKYGNKVAGNPLTMQFMDEVFCDVSEHGEGYVLSRKYMKKKYADICKSQDD